MKAEIENITPDDLELSVSQTAGSRQLDKSSIMDDKMAVKADLVSSMETSLSHQSTVGKGVYRQHARSKSQSNKPIKMIATLGNGSVDILSILDRNADLETHNEQVSAKNRQLRATASEARNQLNTIKATFSNLKSKLERSEGNVAEQDKKLSQSNKQVKRLTLTNSEMHRLVDEERQTMDL